MDYDEPDFDDLIADDMAMEEQPDEEDYDFDDMDAADEANPLGSNNPASTTQEATLLPDEDGNDDESVELPRATGTIHTRIDPFAFER
jgi:hypothetical protein